MRVANSGLHLEDAILTCQEGHAKSPPTHDINENLALSHTFLSSPYAMAAAVAEPIEPTDPSCILCILPLGTVK